MQMINLFFSLTSAILFCSSSFYPSFLFLSPSLLTPLPPLPICRRFPLPPLPLPSLSCSSQLFNHTWLMPKKERDGGEGTNGRRDREPKERVGDRDRSSGAECEAHGQWMRDLCVLSARAPCSTVSSLCGWITAEEGPCLDTPPSPSPPLLLLLFPFSSTSLLSLSRWGTPALCLP